MNHNESPLRPLTLADLWMLLRRHIALMLLASAVTAVAAFTVGSLMPARYRATATLYILRQSDGGNQTTEDFTLALKVVNDCTYLLKSHAVLDPVIRELGLDMNYQELYDGVSTTNPEGTRILAVTAEAKSPATAKAIVDAICVIGIENIRAVMDYDQVSLYEYAIAEENPCNRVSVVACLLAAAGAAVLVYCVFLVEFLLDNHIGTEEDLTQLGIPFLGDVPGLSGEDAREAWKTLRANLLFSGRGARCIAILSCHKGEGRTTTALQLGRGLAALGKRVLVIRGDLRRGTDSTGLSQILRGEAVLSDCLRPTRYPGLTMLPPGKRPENPVDLLGSDAFPLFLEEARQKYNCILIDTPPLGRVIDGAVIASCCDGALLVVRKNGVTIPEARKTLSRLQRSGSRLLGAVLTHAPTPVPDKKQP